jgi:ribosomal protein S18 acetylase RimI-like enzyme|uniref:Acetyltransferase domain containing protein n=1 Tax=Myoviridae sp. ctshb19 TaxID=2825194 RepID=A0A8S5UFY7_9CAUD|nr:MAG TPA: acetyltransferase domain containing protein [Myoviridae sp. ctshb19]
MENYVITIDRTPSRESSRITEYRLTYNGKNAAYLEVVQFDGYAALHGVVTFADYRRKGLMHTLLRHVRMWEQQQLRLLVYPDNAPAIALYRSLGLRFTANRLLLAKLQSLEATDPIYDGPLNHDLPEMIWPKPRTRKEIAA